jgi:hypothetical protein
MSDQQNVNADETGVQDKDKAQTVDATDNSGNMVPRTRLNQEIEKRKGAEATLKAIADELEADVPEDMRKYIPNLAPADKIKWLREAIKGGLFGGNQQENGPDSKRPSREKPTDLSKMTPEQKIALGFSKK